MVEKSVDPYLKYSHLKKNIVKTCCQKKAIFLEQVIRFFISFQLQKDERLNKIRKIITLLIQHVLACFFMNLFRLQKSEEYCLTPGAETCPKTCNFLNLSIIKIFFIPN